MNVLSQTVFMIVSLASCLPLVAVDIPLCQRIASPLYIKPGKLPKTALASFQGSGNTWVRQLLASSTGYKMGDVYHSYGDDVYPEFSSRHDDTVLASKTHQYALSSVSSFKRALVIVRHPLDALYAEFNRIYGGNKTGYADVHHILNKDNSTTWKWDVWMTNIASWVDFYKFWIDEFPGKVHMIYYNNLKRDTHSEIAAAIQFLGLKPDTFRINCTVFSPNPTYFQRNHTKSAVDKQKLFKLHLSKANKAIKTFKSLIVKRFGDDSETMKRFSV